MVMCPTAKIFAPSDVKEHVVGSAGQNAFASWNGYVYDIQGYLKKHVDPGFTIVSVAGNDVSEWFPRLDRNTGMLPPSCPKQPSTGHVPTNATCVKTGYSTGYCHDTWKIQRSTTVYHDEVIYRIGALAYPVDTIYNHRTETDAWVLIGDRFYDVTMLIQNDWLQQVFPEQLVVDLKYYVGRDASAIVGTIDPDWFKCMEDVFFVGVVDNRLNSITCTISQDLLLGCTGIMVAILVVKFVAALQLGSKPSPQLHDRFVIMQVPCYTEGKDSLKKTIDSLTVLDYDDRRKLLFIIADGMIKGAGNDKPTPEILFDIFGITETQAMEARVCDYSSIGEKVEGRNRAKVFSGMYSTQGHNVPYVVVVKCGRSSENGKVRAGNRGKRDSQMILMKFLNKVHNATSMTPLDLELYHHIRKNITMHPRLYEYVLMVDADTEVMPDSLNRLIACTFHDSRIAGICGETKIANEKKSWVTMMQVYEYFISHHMAKAFESLFGSVTCLPGCFSMYRIRSVKNVPLLISNEVINDYGVCNVDTLHGKNLLHLGEDRYLTTLILKHFPEYRTVFTADAKCFTIVPDQFSVLISQRRRWINSTVHNLFELLFLPQMCGCAFFSMRLVVLLDLFATLISPATTGYLAYLIWSSIHSQVIPYDFVDHDCGCLWSSSNHFHPQASISTHRLDVYQLHCYAHLLLLAPDILLLAL